MKKKATFLWFCLCVLLSACVYLTLPTEPEKKPVPQKTETQAQEEQQVQKEEKKEVDLDEIIESYYANRPVRDVPQDADFASFLVGTYAKSHRDFKTAASSYEKVLKSDAENKEIKESLYLYFVLSGQFEQSVPYAYQALDEKPNDFLPLLVVITDQTNQGMYDEALKNIDKIDDSNKLLLNP